MLKGVTITECELCGSKKANRKTKIDNAILTVCDKCVGFGEEVIPPQMRIVKVIPKLEEPEEVLKSNFYEMVKSSRNKMNLKQEELARKINEKPSVIKRIEEGWEPSTTLINKLEKFFNIKLTEKSEQEKIERKTSKERLTIGDVVEIR